MAKVTRFPVNSWKRMLNRRGQRTVNCIVSERYLKYGTPGGPMEVGTPVEVEVLSENERTNFTKTLCRMNVTLEELEKMVETLKAEQKS